MGLTDPSRGRWRPRHLLAAWGAYWAGLIGVAMGPALRATWHATHLPQGHGSISASLDGGWLRYTVVEEGLTTWTRAAPIGTMLLWVVAPPLVLWLLWLLLRSRESRAQARVGPGHTTPASLSPGMSPERDWNVAPRDRVDRPRA